MPRKRDLRVQKTYTALFRAFETLLTKKRFEDITVTELCDAAVIRTATFYKHFPDKYAFVAFMVQELRAQYYETAAKLQTDTREDFYLNLIRAGFDFLAENESLVKAADSDGMMNIIAATTGDSLRQALVANLKQDRASGHALVSTPEMTAELMIGAINQTVRWWMRHQKEMTAAEYLNTLKPFIHRMLYA